MRVCVCLFLYFIHVFIFNLTYVLFKFITFIIYFILILLLLIFLKKWGFEIQKFLKNTIQEQNKKAEKKEKYRKVQQNYNMTDYSRISLKVFWGKGTLDKFAT